MFKKLLFSGALVFGAAFTAKSQIVINEIMYNIPGNGEDEEYVELVNSSSSPISLAGYTLNDNAAILTFTTQTIPAYGYLVIAGDSTNFHGTFGFAPDAEWTASLSNTSDYIVLKDTGGLVLDSVNYDDGAPWPVEADGQGYSIQLCDSSMDNNDGNNWGISHNYIGLNNQTGIDSIFGTPGMANGCTGTPPPAPYLLRTIDQVNDADTAGIADSLGLNVELRGIVHCVDLDGDAGYDFPMANSNGEGIRVFSFSDVTSYIVTAGDSLHVFGTIAQFNGLIQVQPDSISLISGGNPMVTSTVVTSLSEMTENKYVELQGVHLVDTNEWTNIGTGFNVRVTDGSADTSVVRIDADINLFGTPAPMGNFHVKGWGGQYDASNPYTEGYQLLPCDTSDINLVTTSVKELSNTDLVVYPNPTNDRLNLIGVSGIEFVEVYSNLGQRVFDYAGNIKSIDVTNFQAGNYVLVIKSKDAIYNKHFVVIK